MRPVNQQMLRAIGKIILRLSAQFGIDLAIVDED
jgi:hypothetical protein